MARSRRLYEDEDPYVYIIYGSPVRQQVHNGGDYCKEFYCSYIDRIAFGILLSYYISRQLFGNRLDHIINITRLIQDGDLTARTIMANDNSDLGQIGQALDLMADTITHRISETEHYAEKLAESTEVKDSLIRRYITGLKIICEIILSVIRLQREETGIDNNWCEDIEQRIEVMSLTHDTLYDDTDKVDIESYTVQIVNLVSGKQENSFLSISSISSDFILLGLDRAMAYGLMLNELCLNCPSLSKNTVIL